MKKNAYTGIGIAIFLLLIAWLLFSSSGTSPKVNQNKPENSTALNAPSERNASDTSIQTPAGTVTGTASLAQANKLENPKATAMKAIWAAVNAQSLDFYGKVIDQYGQPVVGADVQGNVMLVEGYHTRDEIHQAQTDKEGKFSFLGLHGYGLGIWPKKDGYTYDLKLPSKRPNDYQVAPSNSIVFTMWKLKGAEPMIHSKIHAYVPCDGTTVNFNLQTGRKTVSGDDLAVTLSRNPVNIDRSKPYDWTLTLAITSGGLVEIADSYPNEAPAEGYQSSITISMPTTAIDWVHTLSRSYYFKSQDGQNYGRITINTTTNFQPPPTVFRADIYINPAGSRNLEFDPAKEIMAKK